MKKMELLFPEELISNLMDVRGCIWQEMVKHILEAQNRFFIQAAFTLMMARIVNCTSCNANSYRAAQGCLLCSQQAIKRFRGSDRDLTNLLSKAELEVKKYYTNIGKSVV